MDTENFNKFRIYYVLPYILIVIFNVYGVDKIKNIRISELFIFLSRVIIGYLAHLYLLYILIADTVIEFLIYLFHKTYKLNFLYVSILGILIGYYIQALPPLSNIPYKPTSIININIFSNIKSDLLHPKTTNPYRTYY